MAEDRMHIDGNKALLDAVRTGGGGHCALRVACRVTSACANCRVAAPVQPELLLIGPGVMWLSNLDV